MPCSFVACGVGLGVRGEDVMRAELVLCEAANWRLYSVI